MNFLYTINDIAISFILCLPLYLLRLRLENEERISFHKKFADALIAPWGISITVGTWFLSNGSIAAMYAFIIVPIHLAIYFSFNKLINYLASGSEDPNEIEDIVFGLSKKQLFKVLIISLIFVSMIIGVAEINGQRVLKYHKEIIIQIEEAQDKKEFIIKHAENPNTILSELPYISEIKNGDLKIGHSSPWRINVIIHTAIENNPTKLEFSYNRFNDGWKLDGIYTISTFIQDESIK